jgi:O-antigen/teichoic acid export membrane protein
LPAKFVKNSILGAIVAACSAATAFISSILMARLLGVGGSGTVAYVLWVSGAITTVLGLGFPATMMRFLPELIARGSLAEATGLVTMLHRRLIIISLGLVFIAIVLISIYYTASFQWIWSLIGVEASRFWLLIVIVSIIQLYSNFYIGYMRGMQRFDKLAKLTVGSCVSQIFAVAVGSWALGVQGAIIGYLVGLTLPGVLAVTVSLRDCAPSISDDTKYRIRRYMRNIWVIALIDAFIWSRIEIFFLEASWGPHAVGLFSVSLTIATLATQGPMLLTNGILPYLSENYGTSNWVAMHRTYASMTRVIAFLLFPACFGTAALTPVLIPMLFGNDFKAAIPSAVILVCSAAIGATSSVSSHVINAMERTKFGVSIGFIGAAFSIISGIVVIPAFGVIGAAVARAALQITMVAAGTWYVAARLRYPVPFSALARLFCAAICCALIAWAVTAAVMTAWILPCAVLSAAAVYFCLVYVLGGLTSDDVLRLQSLVIEARSSVTNAIWRKRGRRHADRPDTPTDRTPTTNR